MTKIKPTSILPYTKTSVAADKNARAKYNTQSLSTASPEIAQTKKDVFGALTTAAAFKGHLRDVKYNEVNGLAPPTHLGGVLAAWHDRKN